MAVFLKKYKINILIIFIFLILPYIFFKDTFKLNSVILGSGDPTAITIPLRQLIADLIKNLEMPFWNQYNFSGYPLLALPEVGPLYPITLILYLIFPVTLAYNFSILLHYSLAGIFMYLFLNEYKLEKLASFSGGLIFMFSGVMITHRSHQNILYTLIWFPLILLFIEKFRKSKRVEFILLASVFYSFSFFAGNTQFFLYGSIVLFLFIIYYSFIYAGIKNYYFSLSFLIFIIGIVLSIVQLVPSYEFLLNGIRGEIDFGYFSSFSFNPILLPVLFFPYIFGNTFYPLGDVPVYFGPWNYAEMIIYFGIITIPLLIFGFFRKDKHKYFWIFILVFSFLLVMGEHTPIYKLMYHIPLFNMFRGPARNWFEFGLAFSILAGFGFDHFIKIDKNKIRKITLAVIICIILIISGFLIFYFLVNNNLIRFGSITDTFKQSIQLTNYSIYIPLAIMSLLVVTLFIVLFKKNNFVYMILILLIFLDLFSMGHYFESNSDNRHLFNKIENTPEISFLKKDEDYFRILPLVPGVSGCLFNNNKNIHLKSAAITGASGILLADYHYITGINEYSDNTPQLYSLLKNNNILSMLNTKYVILPEQEDSLAFLNTIDKVYGNADKQIIKKNSYENAELKNVKILENKSILISGKRDTLKVFKIPVSVEENQDYNVSFEIKTYGKINDILYVDFYSEGYDNAEQEFILEPVDIGDEFANYKKIINSGDVPDNKIFLRIFTYADAKIEIKNLTASEVIRYNNYEIVYNENNALILENENFIPRFHFVENIIETDDIEKTRSILWENNVIFETDRFNPKTTAIVQDLDFTRRLFNVEKAEVVIDEYKNNMVKINTNSDDDAFLIFSDNYYPGWKAYIDNKETKIYITNGILKGIYIPKGHHEVIFKYLPTYFLVSSIISISGFIITISVVVMLTTINRKRKTNPLTIIS